MILGENVSVLWREKTATNEMGEPVYTVHSQTVSGCLVRPVSATNTDDVSDALHRDSVRVHYRIAFPKTYKGKSLEGAKIALIERGYSADDYEHALFVLGNPDITKPCPTRWNMLVEVGEVIG